MENELGFVETIDENEDVAAIHESSDSDDEATTVKKKKKSGKSSNACEEFNKSFNFNDKEDIEENWGLSHALKYAKKRTYASTLDEKIATARRQRKKKPVMEQNERISDEETVETSSDDQDERRPDKVKVKEKRRKKKKEKSEEEDKMHYSEDITSYDESMVFRDMNLSRPLLKALNSMRFANPTPIQAATIPVGLLGKDLCACAITGSGKTAAFMLPVLERLLYKPKSAPITRVLILVPTRELAVQVHSVARQLAQFTNIDVSLSAGGLDLKVQEAALRMGPDVVIATPGRLIDHVHNSPNFNLDSIEILILDEADRMLDEYFAEQMKEIIRLCSRTRQTMLFSATMTEEVKDLAAVSLKNPVKIFMNESTDVAFNLRQEFVRIRPSNEGDREAIVAALVSRNFHDRCLVFIQTKKQAHRIHVVLGLLGVNVGELHGNLSQLQRLQSLKNFKDGVINVLLATDVAARGLDIQDIKTVINFTMPGTVKHYVHRVGRTARAGKSGRSVSLVGEKERKMLKDIVKKAVIPVKSRIVPHDVVTKYRDRIKELDEDIRAIMRQEQEEKELRISEIKVNKAEKLIQPSDTNGGRPDRTWFQSRKERKQEKAALSLGEYNKSRKKTKSHQKINLTPEDRVNFELQKVAGIQARAAKRLTKPKRLRSCAEEKISPKKKPKKGNTAKSFFDQELTNTSRKAVKMFRHGPSREERKDHSNKRRPTKSKPKQRR